MAEHLRPIGAPAASGSGPVPSTAIFGLTSQQILFGSPTGGIAQNPNLIFDSTNLAVGIRTTAPLGLRGLSVDGIDFTNAAGAQQGFIDATTAQMILSASTGSKIAVLNGVSYGFTVLPNTLAAFGLKSPKPIVLSTGSTAAPTISLSTVAATGSGLNFKTTAGIAAFVQAGTERIFLNSSGQVGIGTTAPAALLDVNGVVQATSMVAAAGIQTSVLNVIAGATFGGQINGTSVALTGGLTATSAVVSNNLQSSVLNVIAGATFGAQINGTSALFSGGVQTSQLTVLGVAQSSQFQASTGSTAAPSFAVKNAPTGLNFKTTNVAAVVLSGVEQIFLNSSGHLGLGTTTPAVRLDVNGVVQGTSAAFTGGMTASSAVFTNNLQSSVLNIVAGATFGGQINGTSASFSGGVAGTSGIFSANVQSSVLNVIAGATVGGTLITSGLDVIAAATVHGQLNGTTAVFTGPVQSSFFKASTGTTAAPSYGLTNAPTGLNFPTTASAAMVVSGTERIFVNSSGQVGIGTTAPAALLHVSGVIRATTGTSAAVSVGLGAADHGINADSTSAVSIVTAGVDRIFIDSTNNIGFGTTAPTGANFTMAIFQDRYGSIPVQRYRRANGTITAPTSVVSGDRLAQIDLSPHDGTVFHTPGMQVFTADAAENFTSLAEGYSVSLWTASTGTVTAVQRLFINPAGLVGIGTTAPIAQLDVNGSVRLGGSTAHALGFFGSTGSTQATSYTLSASTVTRTVPTTVTTVIGAYSSVNMVAYGNAINAIISILNNEINDFKLYNLLR